MRVQLSIIVHTRIRCRFGYILRERSTKPFCVFFFVISFLLIRYFVCYSVASAVLLKLDVYGRKFVINRGRDAWHISNAGIVHSFQIDVNINI